jgi:hypothetical protein
MRKFSQLFTTVVVLSLALVMVAAPASGSPAQTDDEVGIQAWEPCAGVYYTYSGLMNEWKTGYVVNNCATRTIRVCVDWRWASDTGPYTIGPRRQAKVGMYWRDAYIQEVKAC